jgi:hypothetical protein
MIINDPDVLKEVTEKFYAYETALMTDNIDAMGELFWDAPQTIRLGVGRGTCMASRRSMRFALRGGDRRSVC